MWKLEWKVNRYLQVPIFLRVSRTTLELSPDERHDPNVDHLRVES
jgi:hypothetical protein